MEANISDARAAAARSNGAKSHGPSTPQGKARSSQNALSHGLTAASAVVHPGEKEIFEQFVAALYSDLKPHGATESIHFEAIVHAAWNLRRVSSLESQLAEKAGEDPFFSENPEIQQKYARLARYKASNTRDFRSALRELRLLQKDRLIRQQFPQLLPENFPLLANAAAFAKQTQAVLKQACKDAGLKPEQDPRLHNQHTRAILQALKPAA